MFASISVDRVSRNEESLQRKFIYKILLALTYLGLVLCCQIVSIEKNYAEIR